MVKVRRLKRKQNSPGVLWSDLNYTVKDEQNYFCMTASYRNSTISWCIKFPCSTSQANSSYSQTSSFSLARNFQLHICGVSVRETPSRFFTIRVATTRCGVSHNPLESLTKEKKVNRLMVTTLCSSRDWIPSCGQSLWSRRATLCSSNWTKDKT